MNSYPISPQADLDLSIVVVAYKCKDYILECLESIFAKSGALNKEIIVVDNASQDGTVEAIKEKFSSVRLVENDENRWFRAAANQGIRLSRGRYMLLLNPDTQLLTPDGLNKMVGYLDGYPQIGILGAKLWDTDGKIQPDCERFPGLAWAFFYYFMIHRFWPNNPVFRHWRYGDWDRKDTRTVDNVSGACMLVRRQVFIDAGLWNTDCLAYWEESELCRAAREKGWLTVHFAEVEILHHWRKGGALYQSPRVLAEAMEKSMLYYYKKYYGPFVYWLLVFISKTKKIISRAGRCH